MKDRKSRGKGSAFSFNMILYGIAAFCWIVCVAIDLITYARFDTSMMLHIVCAVIFTISTVLEAIRFSFEKKVAAQTDETPEGTETAADNNSETIP